MLHNWFERADQLFVASYKIFFLIFGVFGNSCFIFLVLKNFKLRSKSSYLQSIQCLVHNFCLLGTLVDVALAFPDIQLPRDTCFPIMSPFVFAEIAQSVIMLELVIDILIIVEFPAFYKRLEARKFIGAAMIAPVIIGSVFAIWGFSDLDDEEIYFCSPTSSLHTNASKSYTRSLVIIDTLTVSVFATLILIFHRKKSKNEQNLDSGRVMKRLQLSIVIFLCSWYVTIVTYYVCIAAGVAGEDLHFVINNLSFFISLSYSQTFYVILYKSMEYRKAFFHLIGRKTAPAAISKPSSSPNAMTHATILI